MKKLKYLLLVIPFLFIGSVNAESLEFTYSTNYFNKLTNQREIEVFLKDNDYIIAELYKIMFDKYNSEYSSDFPYYIIQLMYQNNLQLNLVATDSPLYIKDNGNANGDAYFEDGTLLTAYPDSRSMVLACAYSFDDNVYTLPNVLTYISSPGHYGLQRTQFNEFFFMDSNYDLKFYTDYDNIIIHDYRYTGLDYIINSGDIYPTYYKNGVLSTKQLVEVNLDDYEYVLLNLKNYTNNDSFSATMQVKGSIGITPIYEYGTVEKSTIIDVCNISYSDYTNYRFYVLENDLINNAIYAVKGCEDGSSFKFDNTIFDITYVTADNVDDPVVTIGGQEYHTIPFEQLSNTVNKNTEEGIIPGESESFNPINSIVGYVTSFWNSLTSFMSLVTKFFNTLPIEIRAVSITCFTTACTLGLLKILKS